LQSLQGFSASLVVCASPLSGLWKGAGQCGLQSGQHLV